MPTPTRRSRRGVRPKEGELLTQDVAAMLADTGRIIGVEAYQLAHDIVTVVRERTLQGIETYARENIR